MAYSFVQYAGNGTTKVFSIPFPYISKTHITVSLDGVAQTAGWSWQSNTAIQFTTAPASGVVVEVRRTTPITQALVDFSDGALLPESDLDLNTAQLLFIGQESRDDSANSLRVGSDGAFDLQNRPLRNIGAPTQPTDAIRQAELDEVSGYADAAAASASASATSATLASTKAALAVDSQLAAATSANDAAASAASALASKNDAAASAASVDNAYVRRDGTLEMTGTLRLPRISITGTASADQFGLQRASSTYFLNFLGNTNAISYSTSDGAIRVIANGVTSLRVQDTQLVSTVPLVLPGSPSSNLQAATKQYVDGRESAIISTSIPAGISGAFTTSMFEYIGPYSLTSSTYTEIGQFAIPDGYTKFIMFGSIRGAGAGLVDIDAQLQPVISGTGGSFYYLGRATVIADVNHYHSGALHRASVTALAASAGVSGRYFSVQVRRSSAVTSTLQDLSLSALFFK